MPEKDVFPRSIAGFTEYIKIAWQKASANLNAYGIPPARLDAVAPLYKDYIATAALAANPDTATRGNRDARNAAREKLERAWRHFLNESIRYNTLIGVADLEVFGIKPRDRVRTPALTPEYGGILSVKRRGAYEYEITVIDEKTSKRKLPPHATGSCLYLAISQAGTAPENIETYRKLDFSPNTRHELCFTSAELGKQANLYVRYSNRRGKEGPAGPTESFLIY
jgi:hypothetical protein